MGNKNKKKLKSRKRKFEGADDAKIIEISNQKRRLPENSDVVLIEEINQAEICKDSKSFVLSEGSNILPTRESLVRQLTIAMHSKNLALIEGPIGCGKTFLSTYSSSQLKLPMKTMQMGDQIDSKTLFGSYYCTEVAGQFIWKPSSFSQWLLEPCVILLEDLDLATSDVISTIIQIAASRSVSHLSSNTLKFHEDVCIVATSSGKGKKNCVLDGIPFRIILEPLTDDELRRLAAKAFPRVAHLAKTLTSIFRSLECIPSTSNSRQLASTDLLRGCARINRLPDISCNMMILTELIDVWCLSDPPERAYQLCHMVATSLSITTDQLKFHLTVRQPVFSHDSYSCSIGRSQFSRTPSLSNVQPHRLGHTRDVLQLMERIGVCVQNREPILLVGETGVGKTSIVQTLASSLNITLKVVNLSPTSDSDELITGYKPTTISHILEPFTKFYYEVFTNNFNAEKNKTFLTHLETCLSSGRFHDYLSVVETTAKKALDYRWASVLVRARRIRDGIDKGAAPFALTRGAVLEAAQEGYWLLIDEVIFVNLSDLATFTILYNVF
uniref:AAA_5 domain-containing protein n=1 Tax=Heterorhabditis bacteriophora TaxID=37862 RepID=A0A1I7XMG3_HETBA